MKSFTITYKEKDYVCSMNRAVLRELESKYGFNLLDSSQVLNKVYLLFFGALKTATPSMTLDKATKMLDELTTPNEQGEVDYSFVDISKALNDIAEPCVSEVGNPKNTIKVG